MWYEYKIIIYSQLNLLTIWIKVNWIRLSINFMKLIYNLFELKKNIGLSACLKAFWYTNTEYGHIKG